jgi:hypothetical protein
MASIKIGNRVRLITVPPDLEDFPELPTKSIFQKCLGNEFTVTAITEKGWAELPIGSITGNQGEKIYVAPLFLEIIANK